MTAADFEFVDMVFENTARNRDNSSVIGIFRARIRFDVTKMRRGFGFRSESEKEQMSIPPKLSNFSR